MVRVAVLALLSGLNDAICSTLVLLLLLLTISLHCPRRVKTEREPRFKPGSAIPAHAAVQGKITAKLDREARTNYKEDSTQEARTH